MEHGLQVRIPNPAVARPAVEVISHNPISGRSKMDPQLMGPAGFGAEFHKGDMPAAGYRAIVGERGASSRIHPHAPAIATIGAKG